jgi:hypothetical protein
MKFYLLLVISIFLSTTSSGQKFASGTYVFKYCDLEYKSCIGSCKVVIQGDSITIYATKELAERITLTKEGDVIDQGIILKHKSGKWIIGKTKKDINAKEIGAEGPAIIDFKKKEYWTF